MLSKKNQTQEKEGLHPRNLHRERYDFPALITAYPALAPFVFVNSWGDKSVDFANPAAVKALNAALLAHFYGISRWDIPEGYLCPPIPGRADYIHVMADLLATSNGGEIPQGNGVRVLDIGVGANAIYPILGHVIYGWQFVGTDIDAVALNNAMTIFSDNSPLADGLQVRLQTHPDDILNGAVFTHEHFDLAVCNPPFHASAEEAAEGSQRKLRNLGKQMAGRPILNFAGLSHELWCEGGESRFIRKMIRQSIPLARHCLWFSTLVSKQENLPLVYEEIGRTNAPGVRTLEMAQGQKISRAVAWSFHDDGEQQAWAERYWR
jgi:23S rRNA (adenine1618-N6)-methyltransferase